jgi:hypothetical protein
MFKIDKSIEIPSAYNEGNSYSKYPLADMEVGDSFLFEMEKYDYKKRSRLASAVSIFAKRSEKGIKFSIRRIGEDVRVWRIK